MGLRWCGYWVSNSAAHQVIKGQLQQKKKQVEIRRLNRNYNHDLKHLFKGAEIALLGACFGKSGRVAALRKIFEFMIPILGSHSKGGIARLPQRNKHGQIACALADESRHIRSRDLIVRLAEPGPRTRWVHLQVRTASYNFGDSTTLAAAVALSGPIVAVAGLGKLAVGTDACLRVHAPE